MKSILKIGESGIILSGSKSTVSKDKLTNLLRATEDISFIRICPARADHPLSQFALMMALFSPAQITSQVVGGTQTTIS